MGQPNKELKGRKSSDTCKALQEVIKSASEIINKIDVEKDGSHGIMFSMPSLQPMADEEKGKANILVWGEQKSITYALLMACKNNKEFASMVIAVAVKMMQDRAGENQPTPNYPLGGKTAGEA